MDGYKVCKKCGIEKQESEFNFYNKKLGKRQSICRSCFSKYHHDRYERKKEEIKKRVKNYRENNKEQVLRTRIKTYQKNSTRSNLYKLVEAAEKAGVIKRPKKCEICGSSNVKRIEAHHEDYSKPLDIIWCCTACHSELDKKRRIRDGKPYYSRVRSVRCIESGVVYPSIADAARSVGLKRPSAIHQCLSGVSETSAGFHWEYAD